MLKHGFDMHRVYLSTPGDLDAEKQLCREVISETNEQSAMPSKILLVSVGLPDEGAMEQYRSAVSENIRQCRYLVQVFQDDWGPKNLGRKMFYLAYDGRHDESLPMREVVVFLKDAPRERDAEILAFRKELEDLDDVRVFHFATADALREQLREVTAAWVDDIRQQQSQVAGVAAGSAD
jgi:hypothetical protein